MKSEQVKQSASMFHSTKEVHPELFQKLSEGLLLSPVRWVSEGLQSGRDLCLELLFLTQTGV